MEFQKNRQKQMLESFQKLKLDRPEIPGLFVKSTEGDKLNEAIRQVESSLRELKNSLGAAMKDPAAHDAVYQAAKDVFSFESDFNLTRARPERFGIRELAQKRWLLGYPPRKDKDTSIGDAINWEWIVECASKSGRDVIIVSRDSDYGLKFGKTPYLNEWLRQEFSERVKNKCHVKLTDSLSKALEKVKVHVTKAERDAEEKLIETAETPPPNNLEQMLKMLGQAKPKSEIQATWEEIAETFKRLQEAFTDDQDNP